MSYDRYLQDNDTKCETTLLCSLFSIANYIPARQVFESMQLIEYVDDLVQESILDFYEGGYKTKHPRWDIELLSYIFNVKSRQILQPRRELLKLAADLLFQFKDQVLTRSIISAAYLITKLETEDKNRVPIEVIEYALQVPDYLDNGIKYDLYTYSIVSAYYDLGMFGNAAKIIDNAIEINPQYADAWNNKGAALAEQGNYDEAIKSFDKALDINPQYADAWNNKGLAFVNQKNYDEAIKSFDKALDINPQYARVWYNRGAVLGNQKNYDEAIKSFDKALDINPQYAGAWYNRGNALLNQRNYDEAIKSFNRALVITGKNKEALPLVEKSLELDPNNTAALHTKGIIFLNYNNYIEAEKWFDKVLKLDPYDVDGWYDKARCLIRQSKIENSLNHLEKAIRLGEKQYANKAKAEKDFEILRDDERFVNLVNI
jgi:tetratricopeptide (TPR) repeat protein